MNKKRRYPPPDVFADGIAVDYEPLKIPDPASKKSFRLGKLPIAKNVKMRICVTVLTAV